MENKKKLFEEKLREAACFGDLEHLEELICKGVDVNSKNNVNGWTALHWAAYRNNFAAVSVLLNTGADKDVVNHKGKTPGSLTTSSKIQMILGGTDSVQEQPELPITPNYLKNPSLSLPTTKSNNRVVVNSYGDLVLKLRLMEDLDFIEVELPKSELTMRNLIQVCCEELNIKPDEICKIRKLPNTLLRKDKDVRRLIDFQELEIVLKCKGENIDAEKVEEKT